MKLGQAISRIEKEARRKGLPPEAYEHYERALAELRAGHRATTEHFASRRAKARAA